MATYSHVRSISLPSRSNPLSSTVEEQLCRITSSRGTSSSLSVSNKLSALETLYECVDEFLQFPLNQQALSREQQRNKSVETILDGSLVILDACGTMREIFSSFKECLRELESSLRRKRTGASGILSDVEVYKSSRKRLNRAIRKCITNLKDMANKNMSNEESNVYAPSVKILRKVEETSVEVFTTLLNSISTQDSTRGWSVVSMVLKLKRVTWEASNVNEASNLEAELSELKSSKDIKTCQLKNVLRELETLESSIREVEEELQCVYRQLVKTRVSILNVLNH